ncbi:phosphatidylinositol N-acetylglucosaminyltransferase subunit Q [Venturia canescens]|uniref:phosphatidylinositol N-acetylglucosaminyltransferase subunit Q n=1 Tax=Venturia canescens TaxID=32260 RepID=UPI001C9D450B|nr:phosphatidylinositol N-acetylglucosaminyltransferase subunit Q [Venturia canescens]
MKSLVIFVPSHFSGEGPGYMYGKVTYDNENGVKKFYIVGISKIDPATGTKSNNDLIGYYSGASEHDGFREKKISDWIQVNFEKASYKKTNYDYRLSEVIVEHKKISHSTVRTVFIVYDQSALLKAELFEHRVPSGNHFQELKRTLEKKMIEERVNEKSRFTRFRETLLMSSMLLQLYPVLFLSKITNKLLPMLKYSTLGMHLNGWLENTKWMLVTVIQEKKFTLKTGNHILATISDVYLGVLLLRFLLLVIGDTPPSQILLDNAEIVVDSLKSLVDWLMGAPAGLKLNHSFNKMLGKFFLYHIHLWWTFLVFIKPVMDFAFKVLLLFGRLGVTFQISIAADILALVSFHTYCIYVYAARLFNIQVRGLTALFRLFLGKKKNPLRERVDSCQYQPDQLFVGTLLFTILLFLMPTTWVYYAVFTTLRVMLIGLGGLLTRLRFYMQVMPIYTFLSWLFRSRNTRSAVKLVLHSCQAGKPVVLIMSTVAAPWSDTWKRCIPDTINYHPSIEWTTIVRNIFWGQLLYPL